MPHAYLAVVPLGGSSSLSTVCGFVRHFIALSFSLLSFSAFSGITSSYSQPLSHNPSLHTPKVKIQKREEEDNPASWPPPSSFSDLLLNHNEIRQEREGESTQMRTNLVQKPLKGKFLEAASLVMENLRFHSRHDKK